MKLSKQDMETLEWVRKRATASAKVVAAHVRRLPDLHARGLVEMPPESKQTALTDDGKEALKKGDDGLQSNGHAAGCIQRDDGGWCCRIWCPLF